MAATAIAPPILTNGIHDQVPLKETQVHWKDAGLQLPTPEKLGSKPISADNVDTQQVAQDWLKQFQAAIEAQDGGKAFKECFLEDGWWRDRLTFTMSYRSIYSSRRIQQAFNATRERTAATNFKLAAVPAPTVLQPYPDIPFLQAHFTFDSALASNDGIVNLVQVNGKEWKIWTLLTSLDQLKSHPEGQERQERRQSSNEFLDQDPPVLIIGAGQSGCALAACLNAIGVECLVIEKLPRVGDQWRNRYSCLHLHSLSSSDSLPYFPFPRSWPTYPRGSKVGDYLEAYANLMHLDIWLSSEVTSAAFDSATKMWTVNVDRPNGEKRVVKAQHVVVATGITGSTPNIPPAVPGQESFRGTIIHSTQFKDGAPYKGKNVIVVGTASTGFDIAGDLARSGAKTTMVQRDKTYVMSQKHGIYLNGAAYWNDQIPLDLADRLANAMPYPVAKLFAKREVARVAECDKNLLDGLESKGFRTWLGPEGTGHMGLGLDKSAGYYFDTGMPGAPCEQIIAGNIKVEEGSIASFTNSEAILANGRKIPVDVVVYCTGFQNIRSTLDRIFGTKIGETVRECWGLDEDPELKNVWKPLAVENLWTFFSGWLMCRYNGKLMSRLLAARIAGKGDLTPYEG